MNARVELPPAREVCPTTTRRLIGEGALLVDVRERNEVERLAFAVPGAVVMPLSELEQRFSELPRERELVVACQSGPRSLKATYFLMYQGYKHVANMQGGIVKWASKGFPVVGKAIAGQEAPQGCCTQQPTAAACCESSAASDAVNRACCSSAAATTDACCPTVASSNAACC
jgi:rhodanese-related sulfurtransferase